MLHKLSLVVFFLHCGQIAFTQVFSLGRCPNVQHLEEFDLPAYTGIWYEYARYPVIYEAGQRCVYAEYTALQNGEVGVKNVAITPINKPISIDGSAKVLGPGRLAVGFFGINPSKENYTVLGTDYESWALVYSCQSVGLLRAEFAWILTRERKPSEEAIANAKEVMDRNGISQTPLLYTIQDNCPQPGNYG